MVECVCIDSGNRPEEIPLSRWIQKGFKYHITHVYYHPGQGIQGVELYEVKLGKESYPYKSYRLSRFGVTQKALEELIMMIKYCSELNDLDVNELIKESEITVEN